jgi:hypothetical protein
VDLYIINRSGEEVWAPTQDRDLFIKREVRIGDEAWRRIDGHRYATCGFSYGSTPAIPHGSFLRTWGFSPQRGVPCQIRFRIYSSLGLTSNPGLGHVEPAAIDTCRYDAMAIAFGDLELLREVLVGDAPISAHSGLNPESQAVRRLRAFAPELVEPLFRELFERDDLPVRLFFDLMVVQRDLAPEPLLELALAVIEDARSPRRERLLCALPYVDSDALVGSLLARVQDPGDPHLWLLLEHLQRYRRPSVRHAFEAIMGDHRYPEAIRFQAEAVRDSTFADRRDIQVVRLERRGELPDPSASLTVEVTNRGREAVHIAFHDPSEVFGVWLFEHGSVLPVAPRAGVSWFRPARATGPGKEVVLAAGESREFVLRLQDYFDLEGRDIDGHQTVVRCKIPGLHELPIGSSLRVG